MIEASYLAECRKENAEDESFKNFSPEIFTYFSPFVLIDKKRNYIPRVIQRYFYIFGYEKTTEELYNKMIKKNILKNKYKGKYGKIKT